MPISAEKRARYHPDWKAVSLAIRQRNGGQCEFCQLAHNGQPHPITGSIVVLTVAHLDHDETHVRPEDLAAMCQRCHNIYDGPHRRANAAETRRRRKAIGDLPL